MIDALRQLARHSAVYGAGTFLPRLLALVLVPIYTRHLAMAEYGLLALIVVAQSALAIVLQLGLGPALFREVLHEGTGEARVMTTAVVAVLLWTIGLGAGLLVAAEPVARLALGDAGHAGALRLAIVATALGAVQPLAMAHLRIHQRAAAFSALAVAQVVVLGTLSILFVVGLDGGLAGLLWAQILAAALYGLAALALLRPVLAPALDGAALRRMLRMGRPIVLLNLAAMIMTSADRLLLGRHATAEVVAVYALGYSVGLAMNLAVQAVQLGWPAQLYPLARRPDGPLLVGRLATWYLAAMAYFGLALVAFAPELVALLAPPSYAGAVVVVPWVVAAYLLYGLRFMTNAALELRNEFGRAVPVIAFAAALDLVLCALWIPRHGMLGAAWATLAAYAALFAGQAALNARLMPIPYQARRLATIAAVWAGLAALGTRLPSGEPIDLLAKAGLLAAYPVALLATGVVDARERRRLLDALAARAAPRGT